MLLELFQGFPHLKQYKRGELLRLIAIRLRSFSPPLHPMADIEKKSTSSHEEPKADSEKGNHIDLNSNVSARFSLPAGVAVLYW